MLVRYSAALARPSGVFGDHADLRCQTLAEKIAAFYRRHGRDPSLSTLRRWTR